MRSSSRVAEKKGLERHRRRQRAEAASQFERRKAAGFLQVCVKFRFVGDPLVAMEASPFWLPCGHNVPVNLGRDAHPSTVH